MIENVLLKLGILNDHTSDEYSRVELFVEDAEREEFNNYMQKQEAMENETLGDLFGDALKNLL